MNNKSKKISRKTNYKFVKKDFIFDKSPHSLVQTNHKWCVFELNSKFDKTIHSVIHVSSAPFIKSFTIIIH